MKIKWSDFNISVNCDGGKILKNNFTGGVVFLTTEDERIIKKRILDNPDTSTSLVKTMIDNGFLIDINQEEFHSWRDCILEKRNNMAHVFTLYFLPTLQCQLSCSYCFEIGIDRGNGMSQKIINQSFNWLEEYFSCNKEIDAFKLVFFGGEPLLRKDIICQAVEKYHKLIKDIGINFSVEVVTNGELIDENIGRILSNHNWKRVQITIDGNEKTHNSRRCGEKSRKTFGKIIDNVAMILDNGYLPRADLRISVDEETKDGIPEILDFLSLRFVPNRIDLSFGIITPSIDASFRQKAEISTARTVSSLWKIAKEKGFIIPDEFVVGPWCVAIAKHSAVLQPDGFLQKCFCTVGRSKYDFGHVNEATTTYLTDVRYEHFERMDFCIKDKCEFLPICGGGCIYDAIVENDEHEIGFERVFCQKTLIKEMNLSLLRLNYL